MIHYLVVAAGRADVNGLQRTGALYIYENQNNSWDFSTKLVASDPTGDAKLGMNPTSLDVEGNTIVAGAPGDNIWTGTIDIINSIKYPQGIVRLNRNSNRKINSFNLHTI